MSSLLYDAQIVDVQSLNPSSDFVILVLGKTGSGKTSFIRNVTGIDLGVNGDMQGESTDIKMVAVNFPSPNSVGGYRVVFIDTPGFDQGNASEEHKIQQRIAKHLEEMKNTKIGRSVGISAILYLVAIDDKAIIDLHKTYERELLSPLSPTQRQFQWPSQPSLLEPVPSATLIERLLQPALKAKAYFSPDSDQRSLFLSTTNWLDDILNPGPATTALEWESWVRSDLTDWWKKTTFADAKPCFQLGRLSNSQKDAFETLAEILKFSKTSLAVFLVNDLHNAITHADKVISQFKTLDSKLSHLHTETSSIDKALFVGPEDSNLSNKDVIIAVMGKTGCGKSTFIRTVTGVDPGVHTDMKSSQAGVKIVTMQQSTLTSSRIVLVDTPGFDDTARSDLEIFQLISAWLKDNHTYQREILLNGIIYLHRIADNRMSSAALKNLSMFQKLCGKDAFSRITFVTTMWDEQIYLDDSLERREQELKKDYLRPFIDKGSKLRRMSREDDKESALGIVSDLTANSKRALHLQKELVDYKQQLEFTHAGQELYAKLELFIQEQQLLLGKETDEEKKRAIQKKVEDLQRDLQEMKLPLPPLLYNFLYWIWNGIGWQTSQEFWSRPKRG